MTHLLKPEEIHDNLDLDKTKSYPNGNGSWIHTVDVDKVLDAEHEAHVKQGWKSPEEVDGLWGINKVTDYVSDSRQQEHEATLKEVFGRISAFDMSDDRVALSFYITQLKELGVWPVALMAINASEKRKSGHMPEEAR